jgi:hypothetical protein
MFAELHVRPETQFASTLHGPPAAAGGVAHTFAGLHMRPETRLASTLRTVHQLPPAVGQSLGTLSKLCYKDAELNCEIFVS